MAKSMAEVSLDEYINSEIFSTSFSKVTRLVNKLRVAFQKRELYEAHQITLTIYFRFINVKDKVAALEGLLYNVSRYFLELNELESGQDIAKLFVETAAKCLDHIRTEGGEESIIDLTNSSVNHHRNRNTLDWQICDKVASIAIKLPETDIGRPKFLAETFKVMSSRLVNQNLLHNVLANKFWEHKKYVQSRYHYLHCASLDNSHDVAHMLIDYQLWAARASEVDLFITQFILQFLCIQKPLDSLSKSDRSRKPDRNVSAIPTTSNPVTRATIQRIAEKILSTYTLKHPHIGEVCPPYSSLPLLNFTHFVVSILDAGTKELAAFKMLRDLYSVVWMRDPNYDGYLDRIASIYFGFVDPSKQRQGGGLFNNLLMSLFSGADDDGEDADEADYHQEGNNLSSCDELD